MFGYYKYLGPLAMSLLATTVAAYSDYKVMPPFILRPGDYCYKIATNNGISYRQFLAQNPGIDCTRLHVGQSLCLIPLTIPGDWGKVLHTDIPDVTKPYVKHTSAPCKAYAVQEEEDCSQIAEQNGLSVEELVGVNESLPSWNGCDSLYAGQTICIA
ncbi:hypothetical protein GGI24_000133 [Coemansia furcata]|nr:hypothetical protein GGI24_000133 [Coemansia furcata]